MRPDIRPIREGDEERLARFYLEAAGTLSPQEFWRWKYFENPAGRASVFVALDGHQMVGRLGALPVRVRINGKEVLAAELVDGDVLGDYRKGGLFFELIECVRQAGMERGTLFEFGIGPDKGTALAVKMLGLSLVTPVRRVVKVIVPLLSGMVHRNPLGIVGLGRNKSDSGVQLAEIRHFDQRFDRLWANWSGAEISVVRDSAYLNWRYMRCPVADYKVLAAERRGVLSGFVVLESFRRGWVRCGNIVDLLASQDDETITALLSAAIRHFAKRGTAIVIAWVPQHSPVSGFFRKMGFFSIPSWYSLAARSYQEQAMPQACLEDERRWHYAIGDKDYFPRIRRARWD
jgi:hypothetical protein